MSPSNSPEVCSYLQQIINILVIISLSVVSSASWLIWQELRTRFILPLAHPHHHYRRSLVFKELNEAQNEGKKLRLIRSTKLFPRTWSPLTISNRFFPVRRSLNARILPTFSGSWWQAVIIACSLTTKGIWHWCQAECCESFMSNYGNKRRRGWYAA